MSKTNMKIITININEHQIKALAVLQELGLYPSRSEAIRVAIRDFLAKRFCPGMFAGSDASTSKVPGPIVVTERDVEETKREITRLLRRLREEMDISEAHQDDVCPVASQPPAR